MNTLNYVPTKPYNVLIGEEHIKNKLKSIVSEYEELNNTNPFPFVRDKHKIEIRDVVELIKKL